MNKAGLEGNVTYEAEGSIADPGGAKIDVLESTAGFGPKKIDALKKHGA